MRAQGCSYLGGQDVYCSLYSRFKYIIEVFTEQAKHFLLYLNQTIKVYIGRIVIFK